VKLADAVERAVELARRRAEKVDQAILARLSRRTLITFYSLLFTLVGASSGGKNAAVER